MFLYITTLDGTVRYEQGALVDTVTTDDDGVAKSKELYLGKYTVIEKTAPNGYVHNTAKYDAELTYAGQNVSVTSTDLSVYNERQKVSVSLKKVMAEDKTFSIGNNGEITSVRFGIYAGEDIKSSNGDVIPKDALITFANCDNNGNLSFNCDLPIGFRWYVKEIATDEHYILSNTKYEFDTEYQGQDVKVIDIKVNNDKAIENNLIYGSVKGLKVDRETQEVIKGATFGLFFANTSELTEKNFNESEIDYNQILIALYSKEYEDDLVDYINRDNCNIKRSSIIMIKPSLDVFNDNEVNSLLDKFEDIRRIYYFSRSEINIINNSQDKRKAFKNILIEREDMRK